jgi:hypothetical protein
VRVMLGGEHDLASVVDVTRAVDQALVSAPI